MTKLKYFFLLIISITLGYLVIDAKSLYSNFALFRGKSHQANQADVSAPKLKKTILDSDNSRSSKTELRDIIKKGPLHKQLVDLKKHIESLSEKELARELSCLYVKQDKKDVMIIQSMLYEQWAELNPIAALEKSLGAETHSYSVHREISGVIFRIWMKNNPQEAIAYFIKHKKQHAHQEPLSAITETLFKNDPLKGLTFVKEQFPNPRKGFGTKIFETLAENRNLEEINKLCQSAGLNDTFMQRVRQCTTEIHAQQGDLSTDQWITTFLKTPENNYIPSVALNSYLIKKPSQSYELLKTGRLNAYEEAFCLRAMAISNPEKTLEWIKAYPPGRKDDYIAQAITPLSLNNPEAAQKVIAEMPPTEEKFKAMNNLIDQSQTIPIEQKLKYVEELSLNKKELPTYKIAYLLENWYAYEPQKVKDWLQNAPLSEENRNAIKKSVINEANIN